MQSHPYTWNYIPLLIQVVVAAGMGLAIVGLSWFIGRAKASKVKLDASGQLRGSGSVRGAEKTAVKRKR